MSKSFSSTAFFIERLLLLYRFLKKIYLRVEYGAEAWLVDVYINSLSLHATHGFMRYDEKETVKSLVPICRLLCRH